MHKLYYDKRVKEQKLEQKRMRKEAERHVAVARDPDELGRKSSSVEREEKRLKQLLEVGVILDFRKNVDR